MSFSGAGEVAQAAQIGASQVRVFWPTAELLEAGRRSGTFQSQSKVAGAPQAQRLRERVPQTMA